MKVRRTGGRREVSKMGGVSYHVKRSARRFLALFTNLVASYPEPIGVANLLSLSWAAQGVYVVTKLGIPDLLQSGPKNIDELAAATQTPQRAIESVNARISRVWLVRLHRAG